MKINNQILLQKEKYWKIEFSQLYETATIRILYQLYFKLTFFKRNV